MGNRTTSITRSVGKPGLACACMLVFLFSSGCLRPSGKSAPRITPIATPSVMAAPAAMDAATTSTTANGAMRAANPESLGEGARLLVGREFDPVYFDGDGTELDGEARRILGEYVDWLKGHGQVWLALVGYCGPDQGSKFGYNLAMARALAVEDYLVANGLDRKRIYSIGYGRTGSDDATANRVEVMGFMAPSQPAMISAEPDNPPEPERPEPEDYR